MVRPARFVRSPPSLPFEPRPCTPPFRAGDCCSSAASAPTAAVPGTVAASVPTGSAQAAEKSCIFILLCGGPSHVDTWDMKPDAPAEIRGPYKPIATNVPGMRINELHTQLAKLTERVLPHPLDDAPRQHQQPLRRDAQPAQRAVGCSGRFARTWARFSRRSGRASATSRPMSGSSSASATRSSAPRTSAPAAYLGAPYAPLFVGAAENNPAMPELQAAGFAPVARRPPERMTRPSRPARPA